MTTTGLFQWVYEPDHDGTRLRENTEHQENHDQDNEVELDVEVLATAQGLRMRTDKRIAKFP